MTTTWVAKTKSIYYLVVIVGQKSGHGLTGFSVQASLKSRGWQGYIPFWSLWGRIHFQAIQIVGRIPVFTSVGLMSFLCWLSAKGLT